MKWISTVVLSLTLLAGGPSSAFVDRGSGEITEASVRSLLEFLASDAMNGRGSGTRDEWVAAEFIASQLRLAGLEPVDGEYVQTIEIDRTQLSAPPTLSFQSRRFTHGKEFIVNGMSAARQSGPLVKFKEGAAIPPGAAVLMPEGVSQPPAVTASAALVLSASALPPTQWGAVASRPVSLGTRIVGVAAAAPRTPARIALDKFSYAAVATLPEGTVITLEGDAGPPQKTQTWNAVAQLQGRDSKRASEVILLSAHLDHIGNRAARGGPAEGDTINNGADDDASGCVAVMEIARVVASGRRPRRTIIFAFFGSEEAGGFGSRYFSDKPVVPLDRIVANLQFEMIGRPDGAVPPRTLWLTGYERSNLGPELARRGARLVQDPHPQQNFFFRSDNIQFARRGVVAHTVSSYGLHKEYHTVEDETRFVDYRHMTDAIRSMVDPIEWLANSKFKPAWLPGKKP